MIVIVDTNIFYSALLSENSKAYKIIHQKSKIQLISTDFVLDEIKNHISEVALYLKISDRKVKIMFNQLTENMIIFESRDITRKNVLKAKEIVKDIDEDDAMFVALHLQKNHRIWTGDKALIRGLKAKGYDICITTDQLAEYLYKS